MNDRTPFSRVPRDARGKRPDFYETSGLDHSMSMILVLASELMVLRDRVDTIEQVAAAKGLDLREEIESYEPEPAILEAREARRQAFLQRLYYLARKDAAELGRNESREIYEKTLSEIAEG